MAEVANKLTKQDVVDAMLAAMTGSADKMWSKEEIAILQQRRPLPVNKLVPLYICGSA